ncbi:hypothetical protein D3C87_1355590 [compost metagenome]
MEKIDEFSRNSLFQLENSVFSAVFDGFLSLRPITPARRDSLVVDGFYRRFSLSLIVFDRFIGRLVVADASASDVPVSL